MNTKDNATREILRLALVVTQWSDVAPTSYMSTLGHRANRVSQIHPEEPEEGGIYLTLGTLSINIHSGCKFLLQISRLWPGHPGPYKATKAKPEHSEAMEPDMPCIRCQHLHMSETKPSDQIMQDGMQLS